MADTFDTPDPILATVSAGTGLLRINASDRADTVVTIRPADEFDDADLKAAQQTTVEYAGGRLLVKAPRSRGLSLFSRTGSVDVTIDLPAGSRVEATTAAEIRARGRLGESTLSTASGDITLEETGKARLSTADGDISLTGSTGHIDVTTANGAISVRRIDGTAVIKTSSGDIRLGEVTGELRLNTAYGDITVDRALARVHARTATGNIHVEESVRGSLDLETGHGHLEVGVREGTAAWLDVSTSHGTVRNLMTAAAGPAESEETVEVRARTYHGDVVIRRA
ncbi:DUF4097 family beta strand repeat-containing protein [Nonomuraea sp. NPDC049152]|uniref:DUF4097 family beta strand repeat-containing protein n=1 Tax=Nonomuraea sp. NPDC049152 TaxID=3154350 RepID=UPI0033FF1F48